MLKRLKILDFTRLLPGPFATMMLVDLGAKVLRVESPHHPDMLQTSPPFEGSQSVAHQSINRSKKTILLDFKKEEAIQVIYELINEYDILIEQFRPGVMEKVGLGYEQLKKINPRIIYCSITGYGQTGPYRNRAGHDNNYLSLSGVLSYSSRINEAFACVPLCWLEETGADREKLNVNGGAIALGHPLGASGARLMVSLLYELERTGGRYGLQTICEGHGMANATIIERLD